MRSRLLIPLLVAVFFAGCGRSSVTPTAAPESASVPATGRTDKDQILDAIIRHVLESDFLDGVRADYGTPGGKQVALVSNANYGIPWPNDYRPVMPEGYVVSRVAEGAGGSQDQLRTLGIRIDKFEMRQQEASLYREPIEVTVMNGGGTKNGAIAGGCSLYYIPVRKGKGWLVEATRIEDP